MGPNRLEQSEPIRWNQLDQKWTCRKILGFEPPGGGQNLKLGIAMSKNLFENFFIFGKILKFFLIWSKIGEILTQVWPKLFKIWQKFEMFDKIGQEMTKNQVKIWQKFEIFAKIWPKNGENFQILAKNQQVNYGQKW